MQNIPSKEEIVIAKGCFSNEALLPISSGLIQLPKGFGKAYEGWGLYPGGF